MSQCKTKQDCLRELARVIDMCAAGTGTHWYKCIRARFGVWDCSSIPNFTCPKEWKFAIALVEGKPVFIGDALFAEDGTIFKADFADGQCVWNANGIGWKKGTLSWSKPTPKQSETVSIIMKREDAEFWSDIKFWSNITYQNDAKRLWLLGVPQVGRLIKAAEEAIK
jgi:hypothetical protein